MVVSLDGKSTKADESPNLWASVEDHGFFNDLKKKKTDNKLNKTTNV